MHVDTKMRRMLRARDCWPGISRRFRLLHKRSFCTTNRNTPTASSSNDNNRSSNNSSDGDKADGALTNYNDAYRQLDKLDFMTAAKILFTTPPKKKKFGLDFHLVQLFFALMPSLAVYLVAQYARYEMRRMEAELEEKKKVEEEAKAKEIELNASNEKDSSSDPELLQVKERLHKLEEAVNEIVVESKKHVDGTFTKNQDDSSQKRNHSETDDSNTQNRSDARNSAAKDNNNRHAAENVKSSLSRGNAGGVEAPVIEASQQDLKGTQNGGPAKK